LGFVIEQGLTEAKSATDYRRSIERFFAVMVAVAVSRYVKNRISHWVSSWRRWWQR
jgi:hypothetical protein